MKFLGISSWCRTVQDRLLLLEHLHFDMKLQHRDHVPAAYITRDMELKEHAMHLSAIIDGKYGTNQHGSITTVSKNKCDM